MKETLYVAAPGRVIPGGWPEGGRAIDDTSRLHRRYVLDGDLIELKSGTKQPAKPAGKKETNNGE